MNDYVRISLETHLFFARIMKEHSFFLQAGFVSKDADWIRRADFFRRQFEELLRRTVQMSNRMVSGNVLQSEEIVTCYTMDAERKTSNLTGIPIDVRITAAERDLECGRNEYQVTREDVQMVQRLNERAVWLLNGLIDFKERILCEVKECRMFTANYPLLIEHITREARLYRDTVESLMQNQKACYRNLQNQEEFWNCIMMEHAMFIRGLLDPSEPELIVTANDFVNDFRALLDEARRQDSRANNCCERCEQVRCANEERREERRENEERRTERRESEERRTDRRENAERRTDRCENCRENEERRTERCESCRENENRRTDRRENAERRTDRCESCRENENRRTDRRENEERREERRSNICNINTPSLQERTLEKTIQLRNFKASGIEGLLNCQIRSIILPLLADHVLREANHYIRIQEHGYMWQEG